MNNLERLIIWSDVPESIIHGMEFKQHESALNLLSVWTTETLGSPNDELDFSSLRSWSICSLLRGLVPASFAVGVTRAVLSPALLFFQFEGLPWIFQQVSWVWRRLLQKSHQTHDLQFAFGNVLLISNWSRDMQSRSLHCSTGGPFQWIKELGDCVISLPYLTQFQC